MEDLSRLCDVCSQTNWSWKGKLQTQVQFPQYLFSIPRGFFLFLRHVFTGAAEPSGSSHTNGADGVQPGSREEEDAAHPCWDHHRSVEQQHSSTGYGTWVHYRFITWSSVTCRQRLTLALSTRRMSGVHRCSGSWENTSGERGAGLTSTCQPPGQHLWRPDHGVDGECGYNCSKVWTECVAFKSLYLINATSSSPAGPLEGLSGRR